MADDRKEIIIPPAPEENGDALLKQEKQKLQKRMENGASWFYWIAGASVVNTVISLFDWDWFFLTGLAFPIVVSVYGMEIGESIQIISLLVTVLCAGTFVVFGVFAGKRRAWAFIFGVILYALDGILFVIFEDWMSAAFHLFATVMIILGLQASLKLNKLEHDKPNVVQMPFKPL